MDIFSIIINLNVLLPFHYAYHILMFLVDICKRKWKQDLEKNLIFISWVLLLLLLQYLLCPLMHHLEAHSWTHMHVCAHTCKKTPFITTTSSLQGKLDVICSYRLSFESLKRIPKMSGIEDLFTFSALFAPSYLFFFPVSHSSIADLWLFLFHSFNYWYFWSIK